MRAQRRKLLHVAPEPENESTCLPGIQISKNNKLVVAVYAKHIERIPFKSAIGYFDSASSGSEPGYSTQGEHTDFCTIGGSLPFEHSALAVFPEVQ